MLSVRPSAAGDEITVPDGFVMQTLTPTEGKIAMPKDWYFKSTQTPSGWMWTISADNPPEGDYETGMRIQLLVGMEDLIKESPRAFALKFINTKRSKANRIIEECPEVVQDQFYRQCIEVIETIQRPYGARKFRILSSVFWGKQLDMVIVTTFGAPEEKWESIKPIIKEMTALQLAGSGPNFGIPIHFDYEAEQCIQLIKKQMHDLAIEQCTKVINSWKRERSDIYYSRGLAYYENGKYDEALADYDKAIAANPDYALAYNGRSHIYDRKGLTEKAIQDLTRAIQIDRNFSEAYGNRGAVFFNHKQYKKALEDFNIALELNPSDAETFCNRGMLYGEEKQYDKAIQDLDKAIQLNPQLERAYFNRGIIFQLEKRYDSSIQDFTKALELYPNSATIYLNRGLGFEAKGSFDKALEDYKAAAAIKPKHVYAHYFIAGIYAITNNFQQSCKSLRIAIDYGFNDWEQLKADKNFQNMHDQPCYKELLAGK